MKQPSLVLVCKTYRGDKSAFMRLLDSYKKYNADNIDLYVSVPKEDLKEFSKLSGDVATVITDESYAGVYLTRKEHWGLSSGYINQEICKLAFWENNFAQNYLFVDSDVVFIRKFFMADFIAKGDTPYSVLTMDKDLRVEKYYREFGKWRQSQIKKIFDEIGYQDKRLLTCHGMTVINANVMNDFKKKFMNPRNLSYADLLEISPYEYSWYNAWLQKSGVIEVIPVEPFFKTFHMRIEYVLAHIRQIRLEDISEQYVGVVLNSNWKPKAPPKQYGDVMLWQRILWWVLQKL